MKFKIINTVAFEKEFKKLSSKYPSLKSDFKTLLISLSENPLLGNALGDNCYKIRLPIASKGRGKSGGARVITCVKIVDELVFLVSIYDKSVKAAITDKEIQARLKPYLK